MYISPVNNINFNGKFKNTPVLEKLIHSSSNDTLARFSEVVERAAKVNDNYIYEFSKINHVDIAGNDKVFFNLNKIIGNKGERVLEFSVNRLRSTNYKGLIGHRIEENKLLPEILQEFIPVLEKRYPKKDLEPRENIIEKITKNLI